MPKPVSPEGGSTLRDGIAAKVSIAALIVYVLVLAWLAAEADGAKSALWERYVFLLGGLEAIVFAAVGWIFGKEVHRGQAEQAERSTEKATAAARGQAKAEADLAAFAQQVLDGVRASSATPELTVDEIDRLPADPTLAALFVQARRLAGEESRQP